MRAGGHKSPGKYISVVFGPVNTKSAICKDLKVFQFILQIAYQAIIINGKRNPGKVQMIFRPLNKLIEIVKIIDRNIQVFVYTTDSFKNADVKFLLFFTIDPFQPYQLENNNDSDDQDTDKDAQTRR